MLDAEEQVSALVAFTFKHYKSLDETASMGLAAVCTVPPGYGAPALSPAVMLYDLLHDTKLPEPQAALRGYFQVEKRDEDTVIGTGNGYREWDWEEGALSILYGRVQNRDRKRKWK